MKKLLILIVLTVLLSATNLFAECTTYVSGTIVNETWTLEGSPYCVEGDILVASLTIEPGVRVEFIGNYVFEVAGTLTAIGTEENEIVFTAQETNEDGWQGIFFNYSSPGSERAYCTIEDSINSGIRTKNITLIIKNCTITNNSGTQGAGIYANGGEIILMSCTIEGNSVSVTIDKGVANGGGIYVSGNLTLINSIICENYAYSYAYSKYGTSYADSRGGGIYFDGTSLNATNSIISNNSVIATAERPTKKGGGIYLHSGTASFTNCTVAYNENQGLRNEGGTATAMNCIFWKNSSTQISGTTTVTYSDVEDGYPGEENICSNPIFNVCLQIFPFSPCIDRGNPDSQYNDTCLPPSLEGVRNDMGAHGGPGACEWIYCYGDFDCDVDIDGSDLSVFAADFGQTDCDDDCEEDFDNDGDVDGSNLAVFAANFDRTDCCPK